MTCSVTLLPPSASSSSFPLSYFPPRLSPSPPRFALLDGIRVTCRSTRTSRAVVTPSSFSEPDVGEQEREEGEADCSGGSVSSPLHASPRHPRRRRKLRPSFIKQALERWSTAPSSSRAEFPWQRNDGFGNADGSEVFPIPPIAVEVDFGDKPEIVIRPPSEEDGNATPSPSLSHASTTAPSSAQTPRSAPSSTTGSKFMPPWAHGRSFTVFPRSPSSMSSADNLDPPILPSAKQKSICKTRTFTKKSEIPMHRNQPVHRITPTEQKILGSEVIEVLDMFRSSTSEEEPDAKILTKSYDRLDQARSRTNEIHKAIDPVLLPWERKSRPCEGNKARERSKTELASSIIPEPDLQRLQFSALRMKERITVGAAGVTEAIVETVRDRWKEGEVVKLRFEGPPSLNMKRAHEILEAKTGGIVIWRSGRSVVLYRGMTYGLPCVQHYVGKSNACSVPEESLPESIQVGSVSGASSAAKQSSTSSSYIDRLLDQLGPRFKDWSGRGPVPVDADLLPGVVPGYKPPLRCLPYKTRLTLRDRETTSLRRAARSMTPHFALGRNREHQGLAAAMVKLWEISSIAKIAIKRGVTNTCNDRMAEEIKKLTGGTLLSRNKEYIVFFRGKDFLTPSVRDAVTEKQLQAAIHQDKEEAARLQASNSVSSSSKTVRGPHVAGTLAETLEAKSRWPSQQSSQEMEKMRKDSVLSKHASLVRNLERKLTFAKAKVTKAEKALADVQKSLIPAELPTDLESITDEERFLFRQMGLKMKAFLSVGRRDVFDGTVQNMHFHWKHRELVKIIVKGKTFAQVKHIAISLEAESGGIMVSIDKTTKGYAIVFYRGKNYSRPYSTKPRNLLTRRQALTRSIELQRREALLKHMSSLQERIMMLKSQLDHMKADKDLRDNDLIFQVNNMLLSPDDDNDIEDEGEEAYLTTYSSGEEDEDLESSLNSHKMI